MGTLNLPKLTDDDIIRLYQEGQPLMTIAIRAALPTYRVRDIVAQHGVPLRTSHEIIRLKERARAETTRRRLEKQKAGKLPPR